MTLRRALGLLLLGGVAFDLGARSGHALGRAQTQQEVAGLLENGALGCTHYDRKA